MYNAYPGQSVVTAQIGRRAHPDVLANTIAQHAVAEILTRDPNARADLNVIVGNSIFLDGKIRPQVITRKDLADVVAKTLRESGYNSQWGYDTNREIFVSTNEQSPNIHTAVSNGGAGDTITKVGFATDETPEYLPKPHILVRKIAEAIDEAYSCGKISGLGPDGKVNLAMVYEDEKPRYVSSIVVSAQHREGTNLGSFREDIGNLVISVLGDSYDIEKTRIFINPSGLFVYGGPIIDAGVKGKKDADHTYGNIIGHTGGSAYGKSPEKVDFHALITARLVAKNIVAAKLSRATRVDLTYAIGQDYPIEMSINTFGTGTASESEIMDAVKKRVTLRPSEIIELLDLRNPAIFPETAKYFFKANPFPWERIIDLS